METLHRSDTPKPSAQTSQDKKYIPGLQGKTEEKHIESHIF